MKGMEMSEATRGVLELFRLDGQTALVTGCRRGIGRALAVALAEAGADVIGVSQQLEIPGSAVEREVRATGRQFTGYSCDLGDRDALYAFIRQCQAEAPPVDILVSNHGTVFRSPVAEYPDEEWDRVLEVNLHSQFILAREFGARMLERGRGKIIFIASLLTFQGGVLVPAYSTSKGGIGQLTKAFANEWAPRGVQVNAITPGYIRTDLTQDLQDDPARHDAILSRIPAGRWGEADDFKGAIVFLASAASDFVNGEILCVDGGWLGN